MSASCPAPPLVQGADEDLVLKLGAILFPGFVQREPGVNGLRLMVEGDPLNPLSETTATDQFQILLGVLRAWHPLAGQREDEVRPGVGPGPVRDERGGQYVRLNTILEYRNATDPEVQSYAREAKVALERSSHLRNALWLLGRRQPNAADFYMIYEYAEQDLGGRNGIVDVLEIPNDDEIKELKKSANNLAPTEGGRHAGRNPEIARWSVAEQRKFIVRLLQRWIRFRARAA